MLFKRSFFLFLFLWSTAAQAQIKPKIMIIFDTSRSMLTTTNKNDPQGDGSELCNNQGQTSRIFKLKLAFMQVLQGIGAKEADFALATFPQFMSPSLQPYCTLDSRCFHEPPMSCAGHYYVEDSQDSEFTSYYYRNACKISTHSPFTQTTGNCGTSTCPWYDGYKSEVLRVPFSGTTPEKIMIYFDQKEDTGPVSGSTLLNPEVRSNYASYTPLGKSLFYAHGYFHKEVVLPSNDYRKSCERLAVALFTDGEETCNMLTYNPFNPSQPDPFYPLLWADALSKNLNVVVHTVAIDLDPNISIVQAIAQSGKGKYYNVKSDTAALKEAFLDIIAQSQPPTELCNGKDDDCDNLIDEDFPLKGQPCNNGKVGACYRTGVYVCNADGSGVICNAPNATGEAEKCDGIDNDCDNEIDEGCPPGVVCQPEICNGKDDDCDNKIDNNIPSVPCGMDVGECKAGNTQCINGKIECVGATGGKDEECNGLDDNCDGQRDGITRACYTFSSGCDLNTGTCKGICKLGTQLCTAVQEGDTWKGVWGQQCEGEVGPANEVCDGIDNNCDGNIDEQAECPGGSQCINGQCSSQCGSEEFGCPSGQICRNGWCILDPCDPQECSQKGPGWVCKAGECLDACVNVSCKKWETCVQGACVDDSCYTKGCLPGERCIQGECQKDPCYEVQCQSDEFCQNGKCIAVCDQMRCEPGEICKVVGEGEQRTSQCLKDPCINVECPSGKVCVNGECNTDPCALIKCEKGQVCSEGQCVIDLCEVTQCPPDYECILNTCVIKGLEGTSEFLAAGSGGCACSVSDSNSIFTPWGGALFIFGLILFSGYRRRNRI